MIGQISRWGTKGYGFVKSDELDGEAWLHVKFLDDQEYQPRQGDKVEFEAEKLPDGRYQARRVRQLGAPPRPRVEAPRAGYSFGESSSGFAVKLALPPMILPSRPPAPMAVAMGDEPRPGERAPVMKSAERPPLHAEHGTANGVHAAPSSAQASPPLLIPLPEEMPTGSLSERLSSVKQARESSIAKLVQEAQEKREQIAALQQSLEIVQAELDRKERGGAVADAALVAAYVAEAVTLLERGLDERRRLREGLEASRRGAIARSGLPPVLEYEQLRERLAEARAKHDTLTEKAFRSLERDSRASMRDYADAFDRFESAPPVSARFIAFSSAGQTVLVAPVRTGAVAQAGAEARTDVPVRTALAFWHAVERAARELRRSDAEAAGGDALLEHGQVAGAVAVRTSAFDCDALQILFEETWASRPLLEQSGIEPAFETVSESLSAAGPVWAADSPDSPDSPDSMLIAEEPAEQAAAGGAPSGTGTFLPEVARRIGLSSHDLVALLHDRGLPFIDDSVEPGVEETLRRILGEAFAEPDHAPAGSPAGAGEGADEDAADAPPSAPLGASGVASRMLQKLLRDRRVGGRHTRIEHAYGHHFSDEEKMLARHVAEWLEKDGIFIPKLNEGAHHISINPRRLRDVGQIIDGTWDRRAQLESLL